MTKYSMSNFQGNRSQGLSFFEDLSVGIGTSLDIYIKQGGIITGQYCGRLLKFSSEQVVFKL